MAGEISQDPILLTFRLFGAGPVQGLGFPATDRTFGDVDDENHDVDDLRAADDGAHQAGVAGAVHQRELHLIVRLSRCVWRQRHLREGEGGHMT